MNTFSALIERAKGRSITDFNWPVILYNLVLAPGVRLMWRTLTLIVLVPLALVAVALTTLGALCFVALDLYRYVTRWLV